MDSIGNSDLEHSKDSQDDITLESSTSELPAAGNIKLRLRISSLRTTIPKEDRLDKSDIDGVSKTNVGKGKKRVNFKAGLKVHKGKTVEPQATPKGSRSTESLGLNTEEVSKPLIVSRKNLGRSLFLVCKAKRITTKKGDGSRVVFREAKKRKNLKQLRERHAALKMKRARRSTANLRDVLSHTSNSALAAVNEDGMSILTPTNEATASTASVAQYRMPPPPPPTPWPATPFMHGFSELPTPQYGLPLLSSGIHASGSLPLSTSNLTGSMQALGGGYFDGTWALQQSQFLASLAGNSINSTNGVGLYDQRHALSASGAFAPANTINTLGAHNTYNLNTSTLFQPAETQAGITPSIVLSAPLPTTPYYNQGTTISGAALDDLEPGGSTSAIFAAASVLADTIIQHRLATAAIDTVSSARPLLDDNSSSAYLHRNRGAIESQGGYQPQPQPQVQTQIQQQQYAVPDYLLSLPDANAVSVNECPLTCNCRTIEDLRSCTRLNGSTSQNAVAGPGPSSSSVSSSPSPASSLSSPTSSSSSSPSSSRSSSPSSSMLIYD